jgi:NTE family protein
MIESSADTPGPIVGPARTALPAAPRHAATGLLACLVAALAGCAVVSSNHPHNRAAAVAAASAPVPTEPASGILPTEADARSDDVVALSFSGGGLRAAAFAAGAMQGLATQPGPPGRNLLQQVNFITSVSGGALPAAWVGLHGTESLAEFRRTALLHGDQRKLGADVSNSVSLLRLAGDGLTSWLDAEVFHGATFASMGTPGHPAVWINATNLNQRLPFSFERRTFEALCSDLGSYPVADAVAASMAVPLVFSPVVLEKHPEHCPKPLPVIGQGEQEDWGATMLAKATTEALQDYRDVNNGRFLKLVDGGLTDNFGLSSIQQSRLLAGTPLAPLNEAEALRIRRLLFVVVDGGRRAAIGWNHSVDGPGGLELAFASVDAAIDTNMRLSYDNFLVMSRRWQDDLITWRCARSDDEQQRQRELRPEWRCEDVQIFVSRISFDDLVPPRALRLHQISTSLTMSQKDVDDVIEAGHDAMQRNAMVQAFSRTVSNEP